MSCTTTIVLLRARVICPKILGQSYRYYYYAPDARRASVGLKMVLMVIFLSCAGVSVHLKNPDFAYFVAYIAHSRLSVIGYIYRVKREYLREFDNDKIQQSDCVVWRIG